MPSPHLKSSSQPVPAPRVRALWPSACSSGASSPSTTASARSSGPTSAAEVALCSHLTCFRGFPQALDVPLWLRTLLVYLGHVLGLQRSLHSCVFCLRGFQTPMTLLWSFTCLYGLPTDPVPSCGPPQPSAVSPLLRSLVYLYPALFLVFVRCHCQDLSPSSS